MAAIEFTYSQRVGSKKWQSPSLQGDSDKCYTWSILTTRPNVDGAIIIYYMYTECNAKRKKWKKQAIALDDYPLPTMKADGVDYTWIQVQPNHPHFCYGKKRSQVDGLRARRSMQAQLASGTKENTASAIVRTEKKILMKFAGKSDAYRQEVRQYGIANRTAVSKAFSRARQKQFPFVSDFSDVLNDDKKILRCTERGSLLDHAHYGEKLLLFGDAEMLVFCSPRQLFYLQKSREIVVDGNFKFRPEGATCQVYRIFGFVKKIHSVPLVTVLLKNRDKKTYRKMWRKIATALDEQGKPLQWEFAHFDHEPAVWKAFERQFPDIKAKMCSFHVKQALNRMVQDKGLAALYREQDDVQNVVRMLGALQLAPPEVWYYSLNLIRSYIQVTFGNLHDTANKLHQLVDYYRNTWISLGPFLSLFGMQGQRTTNTAESYHGKLRHHFRTNCLLGEWTARFKELHHAEEENASDVAHGRQRPRQQSEHSAALSFRIFATQQAFELVLNNQVNDEDFDDKLAAFLLHIGFLMGYANQDAVAESEAEEDEPVLEGEMEEANAVRNLEHPAHINLY